MLGIVTLFAFDYWFQSESKKEYDVNFQSASILYQRKDYAKAEVLLRHYDWDWDDPYGKGHSYLGLCLEHEGKNDEARDAFQYAMRLSSPQHRFQSAAMKTRYAAARQNLEKLTYSPTQ